MNISCTLVGVLALAGIAANAQEHPQTTEWQVDMSLGKSTNIDATFEEGTWMNVDVHPSGKWIVFDLLGDLYLLPSNGGEAKALTRGSAFDFQPRFSPSGKQLLYSSDRGGVTAIWKATFDGARLDQHSIVTDDGDNRY